MQLPFSTSQFLDLFGQYNNAVFPAQIIFYILAYAILHLLLRKREEYSRYFTLVLSFFWLWMGVVYHILYFAKINPAANLFGIVFIIQGCLFVYYAIRKQALIFKYKDNLYSRTGWILVAYGLVIYPVLGFLLGHQYPNSPILSVPCPTTIFTFGMLLFVENKLPKLLLVIPILWSGVAFTAALKLTMTEDYGLLISAILTLALVVFRDRPQKGKGKKEKVKSEQALAEKEITEQDV